MKYSHLVLMTIAIVFGLTLFSCKKHEQETLTPKITDEKVEVTATTATFTWTVDWPGKLISVVEVSETEDMSHSQIYGSEVETENHVFSVTVADLKAATKYYYRYLVWNRFYLDNKFVMGVQEVRNHISGLGFTINSAGDQVCFTRGNLQYQASADTWRFAEHQWDYIGEDNENISLSYSGWIDLFGWGTGNNPTMTSTDNSDYANFNDWGHRIGSNCRTLTGKEWQYVLEMRGTSSGVRYAMAQVNNVNGLILLPDDWSVNYYSLSITNSSGASYSSNVINSSTWTNSLEVHGAVFLPAAGYRYNTSVSDVGSQGSYWSASSVNYGTSAYYISLEDGNFHPYMSFFRKYGRSVRLVCPI